MNKEKGIILFELKRLLHLSTADIIIKQYKFQNIANKQGNPLKPGSFIFPFLKCKLFISSTNSLEPVLFQNSEMILSKSNDHLNRK